MAKLCELKITYTRFETGDHCRARGAPQTL